MEQLNIFASIIQDVPKKLSPHRRLYGEHDIRYADLNFHRHQYTSFIDMISYFVALFSLLPMG